MKINSLIFIVCCNIAYQAAGQAYKDLKFVNKMTQQYQVLCKITNANQAEKYGDYMDMLVTEYWQEKEDTLLFKREFDGVCPMVDLQMNGYIATLFGDGSKSFDLLCKVRLSALNRARPILQSKIPEFKKRTTSKQRKKLREQFGSVGSK